MNNPITENLPADLPEDWSLDDTLAPDGTYVGLTEQHGYNYLMAAVNAAQRAAKQLGEALAAAKASDFDAIPDSEKGKANGVAELDDSGKVPAAQLPAMDYDPAGSAQKVQQALNTHTGNKTNPHGVTAEQVGAYTKEQTITAQTAALYPGLDEDGTPNDAFAFLGNYTEWRWNRRTVKWTENQGEETSVYYSPSSSSQSVVSASYSDAISFDPYTGSVSLVSLSSMVSNANNVYQNMTPLKGKYLKLKDDNVYFAGDNYEIEVTHYGGGGISIYIKGLLPISANKSTGPWEEVRASTDDAYPDSGISGGYEYEALGMPLEKAAALPLSALLSMLAEQEQLRADVDFLAVMGGVEL